MRGRGSSNSGGDIRTHAAWPRLTALTTCCKRCTFIASRRLTDADMTKHRTHLSFTACCEILACFLHDLVVSLVLQQQAMGMQHSTHRRCSQ